MDGRCWIGCLVVIVGGMLARPVMAKGGVDLYFPVVTKRPLVVELDLEVEGAYEIQAGSFSWNDDLEVEEDTVFVDEYLVFGEGKEKAERSYVRERTKVNGAVADSALNGVRALYDLPDPDEGWSVTLHDNRALTGELFDELLGVAGSLGLWLELPKDARVGQPVPLELGLITPLVLGPEGEEDSTAQLVFESWDEEKREARLVGPATFHAREELADTLVNMVSTGQLEMIVMVGELRIGKISYEGKLTLSGEGNVTVSGQADHRFTIETSIDEREAQRMRRQKPRFRDRKVLAPRLGICFELPSHWTSTSDDPLNRSFVRTVDHDKGTATIDVKLLDQDSSYQPTLYMDQLYTVLKREYPGLIYEKTRSPIGPEGRVYYIPTADDVETGNLLQVEVYPHQGKYLLFRLIGPAPAYRAAHKEFLRAKSSMGVLRPKR